MRLVDSSLESNPIENASVNATNSKVSWRFAWAPQGIVRLLMALVLAIFIGLAEVKENEPTLAASPQTQSVLAYLLKQESVLIGPHQLCVTHDALRSTDVTTGITTLVTAIDKKVVVFNDKKKVYFLTKIEKMGMDSTVTPYVPYRFSLANRKWKKYRELVFCGEKIIVYESFENFQRPPGDKHWANSEGVDIQQAKYAEAPDIRLSASLLKALEYLYIIPPPKAVPVRLIFNSMHNKGRFKEVLKTVSIEKKFVPSTFFSAPRGYKQVFKRSQVGDFAKRDAVLESVTDMIMEHH